MPKPKDKDKKAVETKAAPETFHRNGTIEVIRAEGDGGEGNEVVQISFSSTEPYLRTDFFTGKKYYEVLSHSRGAMDTEFLNSGRAPFLDSHDAFSTKAILGGIVKDSVKIQDDRGYAEVKLSRNQTAQDYLQNVRDGIGGNTSVGYKILAQSKPVKHRGDVYPTITVTKWAPSEVSAVPVPADKTVGIGRAIEDGKIDFQPIAGDPAMTEEQIKALQAEKDAAEKRADDAEAKVKELEAAASEQRTEAAPEVEYRSISNEVFTKTDDPRLISMAKRADENELKLRVSEFGALTDSNALIEAVVRSGSEDALKQLGALNERAKGFTQLKSVGEGSNQNPNEAKSEEVAEFAKKHNISEDQARIQMFAQGGK